MRGRERDRRTYLQTFGSVDGTQRSQHAKNTKNLQERYVLVPVEMAKDLLLGAKSFHEDQGATYGKANEMSEQQTTRMSRRLK